MIMAGGDALLPDMQANTLLAGKQFDADERVIEQIATDAPEPPKVPKFPTDTSAKDGRERKPKSNVNSSNIWVIEHGIATPNATCNGSNTRDVGPCPGSRHRQSGSAEVLLTDDRDPPLMVSDGSGTTKPPLPPLTWLKPSSCRRATNISRRSAFPGA